MSCGAECLFEIMQFNEMDRLRGNPASLKMDMKGCGCGCSGGKQFKASYSTGNLAGKYNVGLNKRSYENAIEKSYFENVQRSTSYLPMINSIYRAFNYQRQAQSLQMPVKLQQSITKAPMNIQSEMDNLEALITAAKEREMQRWIQ